MAKAYPIYHKAPDRGGATAALITAAMLVIALLAAAAVGLLEFGPGTVQYTTPADGVTRIEQVPNQAAQAISPTPPDAQPTALDRTPKPSLPPSNPVR